MRRARLAIPAGLLALTAIACGGSKTPAAHNSPSVTPTPSTKPKPALVEYTVTATPCVNMRKQPVFDVNVLVCVPNGATVAGDGQSRKGSGLTWLHVTYKQKSGWISNKYLQRAGASASASP